jgi:hypothetical protein
MRTKLLVDDVVDQDTRRLPGELRAHLSRYDPAVPAWPDPPGRPPARRPAPAGAPAIGALTPAGSAAGAGPPAQRRHPARLAPAASPQPHQRLAVPSRGGGPARCQRTHPPGPRPWSALPTLAYAILDGTLIPIYRVANQKPYYSGRHKRHASMPKSSPILPGGCGGFRRPCPAPRTT